MKEVKNRKIVITGANGYIGSNLREHFKNKSFEVHSLVLNQSKKEFFHQVDVVDYNITLETIRKINPDVIIHTAGISGLVQCESGKESTEKVNVQGTRNIIKAIKKVNPNIKLVFISSDYVFDGERRNYKEDDEKRPKTFYGKTKAISEEDIKNNLKNYIICRTANVYGGGGNFFKFLFENLNKNKVVNIFKDVFYTPTYIDYLIDSLDRLIQKDFNGIIHVVGKERISRYQFAIKMTEVLGKDKSLVKAAKQPKGGLIAKDISLNSEYARNLIKNFCPSVEKSLHYCFDNLISPYFYFEDQRGKIVGISQNQKWEEVNYIESSKGATRGKHYHKETIEVFYVIEGKIRVTLVDITNNSKRKFIVESGDIFKIQPNVVHTFEIIEDSKWINMLSKVMSGDKKDIHSI